MRVMVAARVALPLIALAHRRRRHHRDAHLYSAAMMQHAPTAAVTQEPEARTVAQALPVEAKEAPQHCLWRASA